MWWTSANFKTEINGAYIHRRNTSRTKLHWGTQWRRNPACINTAMLLSWKIYYQNAESTQICISKCSTFQKSWYSAPIKSCFKPIKLEMNKAAAWKRRCIILLTNYITIQIKLRDPTDDNNSWHNHEPTSSAQCYKPLTE